MCCCAIYFLEKCWKTVLCFTFLNPIWIRVTFLPPSLTLKSIRTTCKSFWSSVWVRVSKCLNRELWCQQKKIIQKWSWDVPQRVNHLRFHDCLFPYPCLTQQVLPCWMYFLLVQNARTHIVAATASLCSEARNKQTNKKNRYLNPLTQISLWSIACFCNVAQIEKGREKKKKKQPNPNPQYLLTSGIVFYLGSVLPFHFSPGHLTKWPRLWISLLRAILVSWAEETLLADLSCYFHSHSNIYKNL